MERQYFKAGKISRGFYPGTFWKWALHAAKFCEACTGFSLEEEGLVREEELEYLDFYSWRRFGGIMMLEKSVLVFIFASYGVVKTAADMNLLEISRSASTYSLHTPMDECKRASETCRSPFGTF